MGLYRQHKLSLIRHVRGLMANFTPLPVFVDMDAHAELDTLPKQDFMGLANYSLAIDEQMVTVSVSYVCATWGDVDLMRLMDMMDTLTEALRPTRTIDLWMQNPGLGVQPSFMVVANDVLVEPTDKTDQRALQFVTVRLLSGQSGH